MSDHHPSPSPHSHSTLTARLLLQSALEQFHEECQPYNDAVESYNSHLENHRDRCDLYDLPSRRPITAHDGFDDALDGDAEAIESLLTQLLDQTHLDSELRRHPRIYPIHVEACEHLKFAREQLISTLEEILIHSADIDE